MTDAQVTTDNGADQELRVHRIADISRTYHIDLEISDPAGDAQWWFRAISERIPVEGRVIRYEAVMTVRFYGARSDLIELLRLLHTGMTEDEAEQALSDAEQHPDEEPESVNEIPSDEQVQAERAAEESTEVDAERIEQARRRGADVPNRAHW